MKYIFLFFLTMSILEGKTQCYSAGQNLPDLGFTLRTSGYNELDQIVVNEINQLQVFFGVKVDFFFLLESYGKNAMYLKSCSYNCNGTILLGVKMLYSQLQKKNGVECVKAILAHEFGHCVQYLINWQELGKRQELHSDFLAGYYTGRMYNYTKDQMNSLFHELFSMGDNYFWSPDHHGTNSERECAFLEGYYFAKENNTTVSIANNYGIQYVVANNPCGIRKYKAAVVQYQNEIQRRTAQLNLDIQNNNTGALSFKAKDDKKYKIVTFNGFGQQVVYPINKPYLGVNASGQNVMYPAISEVTINPISANSQVPFSIYKTNWFFGDMLIIQFTSKICRNSTVGVQFDKRSYSISNMCK